MIMNLSFTAKLRNMAFHPLVHIVTGIKIDFSCSEMNFLLVHRLSYVGIMQ
jgi:hypothetical protein